MKDVNYLLIPLIALLGLFALTGAPAAQTSDDYSRLGDQIQRNAELLEHAKELVGRTGSVRARASLETGAKYHLESVRLFEAGPGSGRLQLAGQLAVKAREALLQTIALAKKDARLEEDARGAIERATDRYERARQLLLEASTDRDLPRKILDEARTQLLRSQDNMREHLFDIALRLAHSSEQLSNRAINTLRQGESDARLAEREIGRTDQLLGRLGEDIRGGPPAGRPVFEEALSVQRRARAQFEKGEYRRSVESTRLARRIAARSLKSTGIETTQGHVERAMRLTEMLLEEARETAVERGSQTLAKHLSRAEALQAKARDEFEQANYESALKSTSKARDILKDAISAGQTEPDGNEVKNALVATDEELGRVREELSRSSSPTTKEMLDRAVSQQEKAWDEFGRQRFKAALAHTRLARGLVEKAQRVAHEGEM